MVRIRILHTTAMRLLRLAILLGCLSGAIRAQDTTHSLEREILSYKNIDGEIIGAARRMLLDRVRAGDASKIAEVLAYLHRRYDGTRQLPLFPGEEVVLAFWSHRYEPVLDVSRLESSDSLDLQRHILPPRDLLYTDVQEYTRSHRTAARAAILASNLDESQAGFLMLLLDAVVLDRTDTTGRRMLNEGSDEYLARFPVSPYAGYVRREFRYVMRESPWGYAMDLGWGGWGLRGNMTRYFQDAGGFVLGADFARRDLIAGMDAVIYLRMSLGGEGEIKEPFQYKGNWAAGLKSTLMTIEASLGLVAMDASFIQVAPFAGIGGIYNGPSQEERNRTGSGDLSVDMFSYAVGVNLDWKISGMSEVVSGHASQAYWFIRTRFTFCAPFSAPDPRFGGSIFAFTVSFGGFTRSSHRDL